METPSPRHSAVSWHVSTWKPYTSFLCWKNTWSTQEDESDPPRRHFSYCTGSLSCHIFQAVNVIWQQIRGAGIGSHISPSLSNLAVTIVERSWTQVFQEVLDPPTFPCLAIRYFDFLRRRQKSLPSKSFHRTIFINIRWNWRKSPLMNCWVFLLIPTFVRWPINSQSLGKSEILHQQGASASDLQVCNPDAISFPSTRAQTRKVQV